MNRIHLRYKNQSKRQRTWTIHLIALTKLIKATILAVVGLKFLSLIDRDVHAVAEAFVTRHGIDLANKYVHNLLERLVGLGNSQLIEFSVIAFVYAGLLYTESIGLWLQKRWAEYLTTISTTLLIPLEVYELFEKFTWVRVVLLGVNIFIVWYLFTRLRDEKKEERFEDALAKMPVRVKICGITNLEDALHAANAGADELGFNFYKGSSRYIEPAEARKIIDRLPASLLKVGVFVDEAVNDIVRVAAVSGIDAIQLHGEEGQDFVVDLREKSELIVIKAVRVRRKIAVDHVTKFESDAILLDSYSEKERGGTGRKFNWKVAKEVRARVETLYLAGGLSVENVDKAIKTVRPYAVDACSSLESEPGKKDAARVELFIKAAKETL